MVKPRRSGAAIAEAAGRLGIDRNAHADRLRVERADGEDEGRDQHERSRRFSPNGPDIADSRGDQPRAGQTIDRIAT